MGVIRDFFTTHYYVFKSIKPRLHYSLYISICKEKGLTQLFIIAKQSNVME